MKFIGHPNRSITESPFEVLVVPMNHKDEIAREQRQYDRIIDMEAENIEPYSCGLNVDGKRHHSITDCQNQLLDEDYQPYCLVDNLARRSQIIRDLEWMPVQLEYCWQTGIGSEAWGFLDRNGFVLWYK